LRDVIVGQRHEWLYSCTCSMDPAAKKKKHTCNVGIQSSHVCCD
jgi:hypothetical protein